jgi:hypothetical protein
MVAALGLMRRRQSERGQYSLDFEGAPGDFRAFSQAWPNTVQGCDQISVPAVDPFIRNLLLCNRPVTLRAETKYIHP